VAFLIVGVPGLILAAIIKVVMKEPPRGYADMELEAEAAGDEVVAAAAAPQVPPAPRGFKAEMAELGDVARFMFGQWPLLHTMLGVGLGAFAAFGAGQFHAAYFIRAFGLNYAQVGALLGLLGGVAGISGSYLGGWLSDRLGARIDSRLYPMIPAVGFMIAFPFAMAIYHAPTWQMAAAFQVFPGIFSGTYLASTFAIVQNAAPARQRATAAAIMPLVMNLIGMGGGPVFTGWLIDHLAAFHLAHPGPTGAWQALLHAFDPALPSFKEACPGGEGAKTASAAVKGACHAALVLGTRHGVVLTYCVYFWASAHYLIAAIGMRKVLGKPQPQAR
jgi:MFS family permease